MPEFLHLMPGNVKVLPLPGHEAGGFKKGEESLAPLYL